MANLYQTIANNIRTALPRSVKAFELYAHVYPQYSFSEPTRLFRRQFILSHATLAGSSSWR